MKVLEIDSMKKFLYFHQKLQNLEQIPSNKGTMMMESQMILLMSIWKLNKILIEIGLFQDQENAHQVNILEY